MQLDRSMPLERIWQHTSQSTNICFTGMQMKMFHWGHGFIGWMLTTSMTTASVVAHLLIASGRLKLEMCLWPHLIGHAVAFASL
jgi:hypothetical protein